MLFNDLAQRLVGSPPRRVAVAGAAREGLLTGMARARDLGLVIPVLCGDETGIHDAAERGGVDLTDMEIVHLPVPEGALRRAVDLVREGRADILLKGDVSSPDFLRAVLDREWGLRDEGMLSHLAVFEVPSLGRPLLLTDSGMILFPTFEQKVRILENAVRFALRLGFDTPRVAVLSSTELPDPRVPSSMDAARLKELGAAGAFAPAVVDGPLALDLALSAEAGRVKGARSPVVGQADILLCPDVVAGNILGKSMIYMAGARSAGLVLGARRPVVMLSRADTPQTKLDSLVLAMAACRAPEIVGI